MKIVTRLNVFETNSSSVHTLALVPRDELERDKTADKPQYGKYTVLTDITDKLLLACGCCYETFIKEKDLSCCWDDKRIAEYEEYKRLINDGWFYEYMCQRYFTYELAASFIIDEYCNITRKRKDEAYALVSDDGKYGKWCHFEFFEEGALISSEDDYAVIYNMFEGDVTEIRSKIRQYFDDGNALCFREFWNGVDWDDFE